MQTCFSAFSVRVLVLQCLLACVFGASILDIISWSLSEDSSAVKERNDPVIADNQQNCICNGPSCICCVDFNFTIVDFGGPGCVHMKYISQDQGISINVSYGESLLHSNLVKGPNPEPTCIFLFMNFAQICAKFTNLYPTDNGLRGCLTLEPSILDEVQTQFNIGCFSMGSDGMKLESVPKTEINSTAISLVPGNEETNEETNEEPNEEDIIAVVNQSAEESLTFLSNLLGFNFGKKGTNSTSSDETDANHDGASSESIDPSDSSQGARNFPHPKLNDII